MSRKRSTAKKVTHSFSNFSDYDANYNNTFKCYKISCDAYSTSRVTLEEAEETAQQMLQKYPNAYIVTPQGMKINVGDGIVEDHNEGVDNKFDPDKFETSNKK